MMLIQYSIMVGSYNLLPPGPGFFSTSPDISNLETITDVATDKTVSSSAFATASHLKMSLLFLSLTSLTTACLFSSFAKVFLRMDTALSHPDLRTTVGKLQCHYHSVHALIRLTIDYYLMHTLKQSTFTHIIII